MKIKIAPEEKCWVQVGEYLPSENTNVLISDGKNIGFGYLAYDKKYKYWKTHQNVNEVRFWQKLPEPPE